MNELTADPNAIRVIVSLRDAEKIQAAIREGFGFEASLAYCAALVVHVDAIDAHIAELERQVAVTWQPLPDGEYEMQSNREGITYTLNVSFDGAELDGWSNGPGDLFKDGTPRYAQEISVGDYRLCRLLPPPPP